MTPHLLVAISSHGFGHLAQVAPVINALQHLATQSNLPAFELSIRSSLPKQQIAWRVHRPFNHELASDDFGMVMHDALRVDLLQSLHRYAVLHANWDAQVQRLAAHLQAQNVSHVLADAPYLTLAAAKAANIPSAAICSLNWADILERCVAKSPQALHQANMSTGTLDQILRQMRDAYASAAVVFRPEPAIDTTGFSTVTVEPLAEKPPMANRAGLLAFARETTGNHLADQTDCWLVLTSMGGIALPLHPEQWPTECLGLPVIYLMDPTVAGNDRHTVGFDLDRFGFSDMMASCDLVLTKPGYGMFVESRTCGKPMLYVARDDWPESACLEAWAASHTHATKLSLQQVATGDFEVALAAMLRAPDLAPASFTGAKTTATTLARHLFSC